MNVWRHSLSITLARTFKHRGAICVFFSNYESCSFFCSSPVNIIFYSFCALHSDGFPLRYVLEAYINTSTRFLVHLFLCVAWLAFRARVVAFFCRSLFSSTLVSISNAHSIFPCNRISSFPISVHFVYMHISKWIIYLTQNVFFEGLPLRVIFFTLCHTLPTGQ